MCVCVGVCGLGRVRAYPKEAREASQSVAKSKVKKRKHEVVDQGELKEETSSNVLTSFQTNMHHVCDPYTTGSR